MKHLLICFSIFYSFHFCQAQFVDGSKFECGGGYVGNVSELLNDSLATELDIFPMKFNFNEELDRTPVFSELVCISFEFSLDPSLPDADKKAFIEQLKSRLQQFDFLLKSPKVKHVYFHIGEQIFTTEADLKKCNKKWKCYQQANLNNAWASFGKPLQTTYPHIIFYADNWGW